MNLLLESSAPTSPSNLQACSYHCPWLLREQRLSIGVDLVVEWALCSFQPVHHFVEEEVMLREKRLSSRVEFVVEWVVCSFQAVHRFLGMEILQRW